MLALKYGQEMIYSLVEGIRKFMTVENVFLKTSSYVNKALRTATTQNSTKIFPESAMSAFGYSMMCG
jgi:hypothetical protein